MRVCMCAFNCARLYLKSKVWMMREREREREGESMRVCMYLCVCTLDPSDTGTYILPQMYT